MFTNSSRNRSPTRFELDPVVANERPIKIENNRLDLFHYASPYGKTRREPVPIPNSASAPLGSSSAYWNGPFAV